MPPRFDLGFAAKLPPREAIAFFEAKGYAISWDWWEVWESAHARAFTVAKAVQRDVLGSIRGALDKALASGQTRRQFAREMEPTLRRLGWWGRQVVVGPDGGAEVVQLGSPYRLQTIFDSNMRSTFGAARQRQQVENARSRPYWAYDARNDDRVRPAHAAMDGLVFRHDDPIWASHYPPNGWNCRCRVRALTELQVRQRGLQVRSSEGALREVQQQVGVDKRTGELIERPGTEYRFVGRDGKPHAMAPDAGWGSAPEGISPVPPPAPATVRPTTGTAARDVLLRATSEPRNRVAQLVRERQQLNDRINDPRQPTTPEDLADRAAVSAAITQAERHVRDVARRAMLREKQAAFQGNGTPVWESAATRQRWSAEMESWRRLVSPELVGRTRAPRIRTEAGDGAWAQYWRSRVTMGADIPDPATMVHELSHLLEADEEVFRAAAAFLRRRTAGDAIAIINGRGDRGKRDKWRNPQGDPMYYPGRIYRPPSSDWGAAGAHRADLGDVEVYATEILSQGMEWLWEDPIGFAATDPEYFDFIWDTILR